MYTGLTKAGEIYLANRLANKLPVNFLKVKIGNGTVPHGADASETTELYSFKKEIQILDITQTDNVARIRVLIDNSDVEQGFFMKELGVYVDDNGKEKLYWYVYEDNGQYVHSKTERAIQFDLELVMEVTSSNSTILDWNKDKVWISKNYFDEKVRTFEIPTIAELQSRKNLKVGDIVEVLGYYTAGDGAGHKRIIANEDDGSGVQLTNGLWANIVNNGEVNVSWFGAKGDGVTDNTQVVQKALNYMAKFKSVVNNDIKIKVKDIIIPQYVTLQNGEIQAEQIKFDYSSTLRNITLQPLQSTNKPFLLIDVQNIKFPAGTPKCNILIENLKVYGEKQDRDFLLLKNVNADDSRGSGVWGLRVDNINGEVEFNTIIKMQCARNITNNIFSWITYCYFSNIRWYKFINAIELLTFNSTDNEYDYDKTINVSRISDIYFNNCTFEATSTSKTFYRAGNGTNNIIFNNSYIGDNYLLVDKTKYYIFDTRGNNRIHNGKLFLPSRLSRRREEETYIYFTFLGKEIDLFNNFEIDSLFFTTSFYKIEKNYRVSVNYTQTKDYYLILSKIPKNFKSGALNLSYITSGAQFNSEYDTLNLPFFNISIRNNGANNVSKSMGYTNLKNLKKYCILKDKDENEYTALRINRDNHLPAITLDIIQIIQQDFAICSVYEDTLPEKYTIVEEVEFNKGIVPTELNTIYMSEKMKQENVYDDYITYMDEKTLYDKKQRDLEKQKQLSYQEALKENPELTYEEFMSLQPMTLNLIEEPQPSKALQDFMKKYL